MEGAKYRFVKVTLRLGRNTSEVNIKSENVGFARDQSGYLGQFPTL